MFYDHVFNHDDKQTLLSLAESHYLVKLECPEFLKRSKHAIEIRHTVTNRAYGKSRRTGTITTTLVPRIHMSEVNRLVREIRDTASLTAANNLGRLFELGLGVPKQRDIATYLKTYSRDADKKGTGIKYIRKLINDYHRKYRRSMAGSRWCMPAAYTANMLNMQQFIHLKEDGYGKKLKVPDGVPVVLIYQSTTYETAEFTLCDAFMISPLGYPVPFAQIAMRNEFKAVPKTFKSKALRGQGMYSMVMGVLHWGEAESIPKVRELMDIDADSYLTLLDSEQYADRRSPEYREMLQRRAEINADRQKWKDVLDKYGNTTRTLKPEQQERLEKAHQYFVDREKFIKDFDQFEKKENHQAAKRFAVAEAQFAAIDCGTIIDRSTYMAVGSALDKVHHILGKWGFTTTKDLDVSVKKSIMTYDVQRTRVWSL